MPVSAFGSVDDGCLTFFLVVLRFVLAGAIDAPREL
jgi:hypothetical protein